MDLLKRYRRKEREEAAKAAGKEAVEPMTPEETALFARAVADEIRAIQALPTGIFPTTLEPVVEVLDEAETADATKIADDLRLLQAKHDGISPYHLDPIVVETDEMANSLAGNVPVAPVTEAPTVVDVPYAGQTGQFLNCTMGNWNGEPTNYDYQWKVDEAPIETAKSATYQVPPEGVGRSFTCEVTATNAAGSTNVTSNAVVAA